MSIKVRYFASLQEAVGRAEDTLIFAPAQTIEQIWQRANPTLPMPEHTLAALNMDYAAISSIVADNDEVAFFPPVTGG